MNRYEIFFNRRISKIIEAYYYTVNGNIISFYNKNDQILLTLSVFNLDYIEVLK